MDHRNNIVSNVDTLNLVTKPTSDLTDQEKGLEKHSDLPAYLDNSEPRLKRRTLPAESTATMVNYATHEIEQDSATLKKLHRAGYLRDVRTISADLSTNLEATIALHWAAKSGWLRALKYLLDKGVNPCAIDNDERSQKRAALHYATISGASKEVDVLIERGAGVQALDAESWSPLHHAAKRGVCRISEALLKAGASVNLLNLSMETPLHCAARNGKIGVIKLLLDWGADISAKDSGGCTPFGLARQANYTIEALRIPELKKGKPEPVGKRPSVFREIFRKLDSTPKRLESESVGKRPSVFREIFQN